jgi:hypothetical protein
MSPVYPVSWSTTPSILLTFTPKHEFANKPHNALLSVANDYTKPSKTTDRDVQSYNGYSSYLIIVDAATRFIWVFLMTSKEPPLDIVNAFMLRFALQDGGFVRTDQGGELARSSSFHDTMLRTFNYVVEPTGADSPSQNGAVEFYNGHLAVKVWMLLYMSGLPPKFWSAALLHTVYLHNKLVHLVTRLTPFEGHFAVKQISPT